MDFEESPEELAFREEARAWLEARAKRREPGSDPEHFYSSNDTSAQADAAHVRACKTWQHTLYEAGWAGIAWPKEFGGRGGAGWQQRIFNEEQSRFDVAAGVFAVGIAMAGPTIIVWGTDEQQSRFLGPMLSGEHVWCQLFSEPGAGSDLAGLRTRARARRRPVGRQRAEGLDVGRAPQRLGVAARAYRSRRAEAQGDHRVPARHALARHRGAAVAPDQRHGPLQRGLLHRRRVARRVPARPGERGLARREHDALQRAGDDRRRRPGRLARHRHARAARRCGRRPDPAPAARGQLHAASS